MNGITNERPPGGDPVGKRLLERQMDQFGCLPAAPDGPTLTQFHPQAMAGAIEDELARCRLYGWPKLTIHMDVQDALALAAYLKR